MKYKRMICHFLLLAGSLTILAEAAAFRQDKQRRVGEIEFFGYLGIDLEKVRAALPVHEGDAFPSSPEANSEMTDRLKAAIEQRAGYSPTDVQSVCCDDRGDGLIYIGLPGQSTTAFAYNPAPVGKQRLPAAIVNLYEQSLDVLLGTITSGAREDDSRGYTLSTDPTLRAKQLAMRAYARRHEIRVRRVLESAADARQRAAAAQVLGYADQSDGQVAALVRASRDVNEDVRNNAVRALSVISRASPKRAAQIPAPPFIQMLSSGTWTDRNKAGFLLGQLSEARDPKLLGQLRAGALPPLIEMARWRHPGHAYSARILLGRIAGIEESRLQQLLKDRQVETIIKAL
jgi:hypothetical protein